MKKLTAKIKTLALFQKKYILSILLLNILSKELSNLLFKPFDNYGKLKKRWLKKTFMSKSLEDLDYITNQFKC